VRFLVDENMPHDLATAIGALGFPAQHVGDIGLLGCPDPEVMQAAIATDAIIITRDRGFADPRGWPQEFTAGVIFINLPNDVPAPVVSAKILDLIQTRQPNSLLGAYTTVELRRILSRPIRSR
jgi:predicted nuclease of predicted toxin-antitoxin system